MMPQARKRALGEAKMMRAWRWAAGLALGVGLALGAQAVASSPQPASVDDFVLPDQDYLARQL
jgi:hypothetical protein